MSPKTPIPKNKTEAKDLQELGRRLNNIYLMGYVSRWEMMKMGFLKGLAAGTGGVVGATIAVALLLWILSLFDSLPLVGPIVENLEGAVKSQQK